MAQPTPVLTQAERLEAALAERGYSVREFAKILAGPEASTKRWEAERRNLTRWLSGQPMFPKSARKVATALGEDASDWVIPRRARAEDEQFVALEQRVDSLEGRLEQAIALLSELRAAQPAPAAEPDARRATQD